MANKKTGKKKTGKKKTGKAIKPKQETGKGLECSLDVKGDITKEACAKLESVKALHSLPLFTKIFGGEIEQSEEAQTKLANAATVNPDLTKVIGQTKNAIPLRIKKSALVLFCKVAQIANKEFSAQLKEASGHPTTSTINKHDLQIALFSFMSVIDFVATYKAYQETLASE